MSIRRVLQFLGFVTHFNKWRRHVTVRGTSVSWTRKYNRGPSEAPKSTPEELAAAKAPRRRFAVRANKKVRQYGRSDDLLDWQTITAGPWTCHNCGIVCESWDHLEPLALGGANKAENLQPSCVPCNQQRTAGLGAMLMPLKTHCKRGHELAGDNIRYDGKGIRRCRACGSPAGIPMVPRSADPWRIRWSLDHLPR